MPFIINQKVYGVFYKNGVHHFVGFIEKIDVFNEYASIRIYEDYYCDNLIKHIIELNILIKVPFSDISLFYNN